MTMRCENDNDAMLLRCGGSECSDNMSIKIIQHCSRNYMPKNIVHDPNRFGHGKFSLGINVEAIKEVQLVLFGVNL
jgi:hypothetical protein